MQGHFATKYTWGAITWVIVHKRPAACELVFHIRQSPSTGVKVVLPAYAQADAVTTRDHDGGRPYFDIKFVDLAWC